MANFQPGDHDTSAQRDGFENPSDGWTVVSLSLSIPIEVKPSEIPGVYVARSRFGDVVTQGEGHDEAVESLREAIGLMAHWMPDPDDEMRAATLPITPEIRAAVERVGAADAEHALAIRKYIDAPALGSPIQSASPSGCLWIADNERRDARFALADLVSSAVKLSTSRAVTNPHDVDDIENKK